MRGISISPQTRRSLARNSSTRRRTSALFSTSPGSFSNHRLQHVFVEAEVGDQSLQPRILFAELLDLLRLAHVQTSVLRLPGVDRVLGHTVLASQILHRSPRLHLLQRSNDLRLAVLALAHPLSPFVRPKSYSIPDGLRGSRHPL